MPEILDTNRMLANEFEPKRPFRWILEIDGIDAFTAATTSRPKKEFEKIEINYINQKRYLAGKGTWQTIKIELYDPISPSAMQKVIEWLRLVHDDATGRMGYASLYKRNFSLKMLDPGGVVIEKWTAKGAWPTNIDGGELDYSNNEALKVSFDVQADAWELNF